MKHLALALGAALPLLTVVPAQADPAPLTGIRATFGETTSLESVTVAADGHVLTHTALTGLVPGGTTFQPTDMRGSVVVGTSRGELSSFDDIRVIDLVARTSVVVAKKGYSPVLTADGLRVYFTKESQSQKPGAQKVYTVAASGGPVTQVLSPPSGRNFTALGMAPDGKHLYACTETPLQGGTQADFARLRAPKLLVGNLSTGKTATVKTGTELAGVGCSSISVNPAGTKLAVGLNITQGDDPTLSVVTLSTHKVTRIGAAHRWRLATGWSADGTRVVAEPTNGTKGPRLVGPTNGSLGPYVAPQGATLVLSR